MTYLIIPPSGMIKGNLLFTVIVGCVFTLVVYYLTAPLATAPDKAQPKIQQAAIQPTEDSWLQESEEPMPESPPLNRADHPTASPARTTSGVTVRYYTKPTVPNIKYLTVYIDDVPTEMILDTGASFITVNAFTMNKLRISTPLMPSISNTAAGRVYSYLFTAPSIRIDSIELKNIQCSYLPTASDNLLGGSFLQNFHYAINEVEQTITFIPNDENIQWAEGNPERSAGEGWAEIDGRRFVYHQGRMEPAK